MTGFARISSDVGGTLALEFANTADWHLSDAPAERLTTWPDLGRWATEQALLTEADANELAASRQPFEEVAGFREAIFRIFLAATRGEAPDRMDLAQVTEAASEPLPVAIWSQGKLNWRLDAQVASRQVLGIVARDAVALLGSDRLRRVRVCDGGECGWLFIDESRGRPRRWCSMGDCGNRAKARDLYARRRGKKESREDRV